MSAPSARPLRLVLVEDDPGHATLIARNLKRAGVANELVLLTDGQQAVDYVRAEGAYAARPPGRNLLLLLDVNLPRLDGFEVLRRIKADPATAGTPIILLTTTDDPRDVARGYGLGCSVYIAKPVPYEAFVEAIRRLGLFLEIIQVPPAEGDSK